MYSSGPYSRWCLTAPADCAGTYTSGNTHREMPARNTKGRTPRGTALC